MELHQQRVRLGIWLFTEGGWVLEQIVPGKKKKVIAPIMPEFKEHLDSNILRHRG